MFKLCQGLLHKPPSSARIVLGYAFFSILWVVASDRFLQFAVEDTVIHGRLELAKGLLFVAVTSGLLYLVLETFHVRQNVKTVWNNKDEESLKTRHLALGLVGLALVVPLIGSAILNLYGPQEEKDALANLEAIADLKAKQIEGWMTERQNVGVAMLANDKFISRVEKLRRHHEAMLESYVRYRLEAIREAHGFDGVTLMDPSGHILLGLGDHPENNGLLLQPIATALRTGQVQQSHLTLKNGILQLNYIVPLLKTAASKRVPVGVAVLHADSEHFLFPYIQHWPSAHSSGETLLVHRDDEAVAFLNKPRYQTTDDQLRHSLSDTNNPAAVAINSNKPGTMHGLDYRGVAVFAAYRPVHGTPWFLVAKIDRDEVLQPLRNLAFWIALISFCACIAVGTALLLLWRQQKRAQQMAMERKADALLKHFYSLPFIGMGIISSKMDYWYQCNDMMCDIFGYSHDEMVSRKWEDLFHADDANLDANEIGRMRHNESDGYKINKRIIRKDGRIAHVSIDLKCVRKADQSIDFLFVTLKDITEQKAAALRIHRLTQLYAALSHCNQAIVRHTHEEALFPELCRIAVEFGSMKMACFGMLDENTDKVHAVASHGMNREYLDGIHFSVDATDLVGTAIKTNRPVWCQDISDSGFSTPPIERARRYGWRSAAALPLSRKGRIVGAFVLYASEANAFDQEACNLLQEMALDISFAMDNFIQEKAHREAQHQLQLAGEVFEQSREGFMITGPNGNIQLVNRAFTEITGFSCNDVLGKTPHILSSGHQDEQFYRAMWASLNTQGCWQGEVLNRKKDGSLYLAWLAISKITGKDGSAAQYIGIHSDITQYKANEDRMNWLAHFDTLTGLPNRTLLEDRSRQAIGITQRSGKPMAVMFLDLDHFKNINDSLGYRIGDTLLAMLAKRLQSVLQEKDTLSRFGGDSFLILLPGVEANEAAHLARKLLAAVEPPYRIKQHELAITASIGVAMCPDNGQDLESLSKCADAAMYRAKQDGRNTFCFFTKEMQANVSRELLLENALRRALERQQLALHYQPQMSLKDGNIVGAEALLRWQHPEFGMIPPDEFIPIAESHGMIQAIGEWVLKTALHQFKLWMDQGLRLTSIAVNLSALQLRDANLPERVMQILEEAGVPAQYLELELTESAMMEDPGQAMALMEKLHSHGIRMSIDDFGTGYSSLGHLKRFNAYKLKIDRSFVRDIPDDIDDKALVNAIIKMADSLGLHTIAEGVETEEQLNFLRKNGCDEIQGYYCSRPLPVQQFGTLLQQQLPPKFGDTVHAR